MCSITINIVCSKNYTRRCFIKRFKSEKKRSVCAARFVSCVSCYETGVSMVAIVNCQSTQLSTQLSRRAKKQHNKTMKKRSFLVVVKKDQCQKFEIVSIFSRVPPTLSSESETSVKLELCQSSKPDKVLNKELQTPVHHKLCCKYNAAATKWKLSSKT